MIKAIVADPALLFAANQAGGNGAATGAEFYSLLTRHYDELSAAGPYIQSRPEPRPAAPAVSASEKVSAPASDCRRDEACADDRPMDAKPAQASDTGKPTSNQSAKKESTLETDGATTDTAAITDDNHNDAGAIDQSALALVVQVIPVPLPPLAISSILPAEIGLTPQEPGSLAEALQARLPEQLSKGTTTNPAGNQIGNPTGNPANGQAQQVAAGTTSGADIPDATVIVEAASTEKSGTDAAQLETALIVATTVVGLEQATTSDLAIDATIPADDPLPASTPASPAPALAHELRDLSNGGAVAAAARNIGDVASADAPGQSKPDGQKNAVGRGEEQASRPVPRPEADPTSNRDRSPVEPVAIAAAIAGRTQAATADSSDQSSEGDNVHALTGIGQPPRANGLTLANAATPANRGLPTHLPVPEQLAVHIQRAARDGLDRIDIRLSPAALGRIEVRLEFGHDGRLTATIAADRPETLDQLQRDARGLERALEAAGLKTDAGGLSFNLRGDNRQDAQNNQRLTQTGSATLLLDTALPEDASSAALASTARPNGLLDIRV